MGNHHHEDERYQKFYDRTPHGEVPSDPRVRQARQDGADPVPEEPPAEPETDPGKP